MIRIDQSRETVLVACDCGYRQLVTCYTIGLRVAATHEANAHPEKDQARNMRRVAATRRPTMQSGRA